MARIKKDLRNKPTFAVVVDGECESWYINMLRRNEHSINVHLKPEIPQKKKLSDQYKKVIELENHYDKVIWIIDFDVINSETNKTPKGTKTALQEFREYRQEIDRDHENILIIINNPCLEYWFLLHFEKTSKYFSTCEEAGKQLKKHLPDYEKTQRFYTKESNDIYLKLKPHLDQAITNANSLDEFDINNPKKGITEMQKLFVMNGIKQSFPALTTGERKTNS